MNLAPNEFAAPKGWEVFMIDFGSDEFGVPESLEREMTDIRGFRLVGCKILDLSEALHIQLFCE